MKRNRKAERLTPDEMELLWVYRHFESWYQHLPIEEKRRIQAVPNDQRGRVVFELIREHWIASGQPGKPA